MFVWDKCACFIADNRVNGISSDGISEVVWRSDQDISCLHSVGDSRYVRLVGDSGIHQQHNAETIYGIYTGEPGVSQEELYVGMEGNMLLERGKSGLPCWTCCYRDSTLDKRQNGWMAI